MIRSYIVKSILCLVVLLCYFCAYGQEVVRFGVIADPQYADKQENGTRYYRSSLTKLDTAMDYFNSLPLDFTVVVGDFVDNGIKDLPPIMQRLSRLQHPVYNLLGNHDYEDAPDKMMLYQHFNMEAPYYTFESGNWLFIVLNTNELSGYATLEGTPLYTEWVSMRDRLEAEGRKHVAPWNGGVGGEQLRWMKDQLGQAAQSSKNVLVFSHHPLFPENGLEALNNREILNLIEQYTHVRAVISGHHHSGNFAEYKGVPVITLEGMVETADQNAFGIVELYPDKMIISGKGRLTSRTIAF